MTLTLKLLICSVAFLLIQLKAEDNPVLNTIYSFTAKDSDNNDVSLSKYRGKVVIIVNVASECGLTQTNYVQLKQILDKYKKEGLEVAAFPSNQFGGQEPQSNAEIRKFIHTKFEFEPDLYAKIEVNGANEHPLYKFLKQQQPGTLYDDIKWNFTKFLVNRKGQVVERYAPTTSPKTMIEDIEKLLAESA